MHVSSLALCVWEWRRYTIQYREHHKSCRIFCSLRSAMFLVIIHWRVIIVLIRDRRLNQRWPKPFFQTPIPLLFQNFWICVRQFFKF